MALLWQYLYSGVKVISDVMHQRVWAQYIAPMKKNHLESYFFKRNYPTYNVKYT